MTHSNPKEAARINKLSLSIIIPVYNGEKYLRECLDSIYNNFDDIKFSFETIIIDDGSTDDSASIYKEYSKKYKNIVYFKTDNKGVSSARNFGLMKAVGKFILFVDCDDLVKYGWHDIISPYLTENYDFIFLSRYFKKEEDADIQKGKIASYVATYNEDSIMISGPYSKLYNRSFIRENGIRFKEDIINGEDLLFNLEVVGCSKNYLLKKASFYKVRHHDDSSTSKLNDRIIISEVRFNTYINKIAAQYNFVDDIEKRNSFLTSVRTLCLRSGRATTFKDAKNFYRQILKNSFYANGFSKYTYTGYRGGVIFCKLLRKERFFLTYHLAKFVNKHNKTDILEEL